MKKIIAILLIMLCLVTSVVAADTEYDPSIDYMDIMLQAAARGDIDTLKEAARLRDLKIEGEHMSWKPVSPQELMDNFESYVGYSLYVDYMDLMYQCARNGDYNGGREAARKRNIKIAFLGMNYKPYSFDEFILLSKVIYTEAGDDSMSLEWKICVGEVVLNRVANPHYPNSIYDVVYQRGQYAGTGSYGSKHPTTACYKAVIALFNGYRVFNDTSVVYQANFRQGHGVARTFYHNLYGTTYFCYY